MGPLTDPYFLRFMAEAHGMSTHALHARTAHRKTAADCCCSRALATGVELSVSLLHKEHVKAWALATCRILLHPWTRLLGLTKVVRAPVLVLAGPVVDPSNTMLAESE